MGILDTIRTWIPGRRPGDTITAHLLASLEAHGLSVARRGQLLSVDGGRLRLEAEVFDRETVPGRCAVVLELRAYSQLIGEQPIIECFAGIGDDRRQAIAEAFSKMLMGSFHVVIGALSSHTCAEQQAEIEQWNGSTSSWQVFSGPLLTQHSGASTLAAGYSSFLPQLQSLFVATMPPGPHWIRVFLGTHHHQVQVGEVLLDNEHWEQGHALLLSQEWTCTHEYQSIRHFALALPSAIRSN